MELLNNITEAQLEVIYFLNKSTKGKWSINKETGLIDINGDFIYSNAGLKDFKAVRFGVVNGDFNCSANELTSLEGAPQEVGGSFYCQHNKLTSLKGAPQEVKRDFSCSYNELTSLEGSPQEVGGSFNCHHNKLKSLEGAPQVVGGSFYCFENKINSLEGAPQNVGNFRLLGDNPISEETLKLVWMTMQEKKIGYWEALVILKNKISENDFNKLSVGLDERLSQDSQKGISMLGRFGHFD